MKTRIATALVEFQIVLIKNFGKPVNLSLAIAFSKLVTEVTNALEEDSSADE